MISSRTATGAAAGPKELSTYDNGTFGAKGRYIRGLFPSVRLITLLGALFNERFFEVLGLTYSLREGSIAYLSD
jgi:hypothetical protein